MRIQQVNHSALLRGQFQNNFILISENSVLGLHGATDTGTCKYFAGKHFILEF